MPRLSCPFCNASFEPPPEGRVACPRCGETVPVRGRESAPQLPAAVPEPPKRLVMPVVLAVAVCVGLAAAYLALNRTEPAPPPPPPPPPIGTPVAPAKLRGLDYLPADANLVLAAQVSPVVEYAKRTGGNPFEVLTKAGVPAAALAALGQGGVALPNIDHVAAGATIPDAGDFRLGVALVLRGPVHDEAKFLDALKAKRPATGTPPHYLAEFGGFPLKLTKAADAVWLFGLTERDLTPAAGGLSERMRASLTEALPADAAAWLLTDSADWAAKPLASLLLNDVRPGLAKVRAVAAGLTVSGDANLRVLVRPANPAARDEFAAAFRRRGGTTGETGDWVYLDAPADRAGALAAVRDVLIPK